MPRVRGLLQGVRQGRAVDRGDHQDLGALGDHVLDLGDLGRDVVLGVLEVGRVAELRQGLDEVVAVGDPAGRGLGRHRDADEPTCSGRRAGGGLGARSAGAGRGGRRGARAGGGAACREGEPCRDRKGQQSSSWTTAPPNMSVRRGPGRPAPWGRRPGRNPRVRRRPCSSGPPHRVAVSVPVNVNGHASRVPGATSRRIRRGRRRRPVAAARTQDRAARWWYRSFQRISVAEGLEFECRRR